MIPLFKPYMPDLPELDGILHSGALAYGKFTMQFEEKLREYFGTPYVIVTNNFNTAISVAVTTAGLTFGDEVIASPMACLASTQPYLSCGLKIKWCDVDPKTGTLLPSALKDVITNKTKAVIHNHFCGYPGYVNEVNEICGEFGVPVIDDGIECFGSEYKGRKIGSIGTDITIFSLTAVRIPNTIDGGIIIFKDKHLFEKSLRIRDCGIDRLKFRDDIGEISPYCDISEIGYSATMSNVNGYIGLRQMECVDELLSIQRKNASILKERLSSDGDIKIIRADDSNPNYWVFGVLARDKRKTILKYREKGLNASGVHINNNIYSVFGNQDRLPGVTEFYNRFVALPSGWWVDDYKCL